MNLRFNEKNNCDDVPDETGSAYVEMNDLICEIDDICFYKIEFSGYKDNPLDFEQLGIDHEEPFESFIEEHPNAFGDFYMCQAFENLMNGCLFSKQDILRLLNFWCDAEIVHQCGVNVKGNYIKTVEYER